MNTFFFCVLPNVMITLSLYYTKILVKNFFCSSFLDDFLHTSEKGEVAKFLCPEQFWAISLDLAIEKLEKFTGFHYNLWDILFPLQVPIDVFDRLRNGHKISYSLFAPGIFYRIAGSYLYNFRFLPR